MTVHERITLHCIIMELGGVMRDCRKKGHKDIEDSLVEVYRHLMALPEEVTTCDGRKNLVKEQNHEE